jgi:hypothetical protein
MKRRAAVHARRGRLFVSSWSATEGQYPAYVPGGWIEAADEPVPDADLGDLVRLALANFKSGVPHPNFREGLTPEARRFLDVTKAKSFAAFARRTREVDVESDDAAPNLLITPYRNEGRDGFTEMLDKVITVAASADNVTLGAAVRRELLEATDRL